MHRHARQERPGPTRGGFPGGHVIEVPLEEVSEEDEVDDDDLEGDSESDSSGSSVGSQTTGSRTCDVGWESGAQVRTIQEEEEWEEEEWEEQWPGQYGDDDYNQARMGPEERNQGKLGVKKPEAQSWIRSQKAELFFGGVIGVNALVIGLEVEAELRFGEESPLLSVLYWLQCIFALVFVTELLLRARADGLRKMMCGSLNGLFDTAVVLITVADLWIVNPLVRFTDIIGGGGQKTVDALSMLRILQLLRLVRIIRLLRVSRQLSLLVVGLAKSFRSVLWVFLMLFVVIYIGALFCASELGTVDDENLKNTFGTIWLSMYSHFKIMTLEAWPDICGWSMEQHTLWAFYFIAYILVTNLALVNLVTGLIMDGVLQGAKTEDWTSELMVFEAEPFVETVRSIIGAQDSNRDHHLDREEFKNLLAVPFFQEVLRCYGISLRIEPDDLFDVLDIHGAGALSVVELAGSLLRLRGSRDALHPLLVRDDLHKESRRILASLKASQKRISEGYDAEVRRVEQSLCSKLQDVQHAAGQASASWRHVARTPQGPAGAFDVEQEQEAGTNREFEAMVKCQGKAVPQIPVVMGTVIQEQEPSADIDSAALRDCNGKGAPQMLQAQQAMDEAEKDAANKETARVIELLQQASAKVRLLEGAVRGAEAELHASLAREAALELELTGWETSRATQTVGELCAVEPELAPSPMPISATQPVDEEIPAPSEASVSEEPIGGSGAAEGAGEPLHETSSPQTPPRPLSSDKVSQASSPRSDHMLRHLRNMAAQDPAALPLGQEVQSDTTKRVRSDQA